MFQDSKLLVTAEPTAWRKNRMDALGAALAAWYSAKGMDRTPVVLELTHLGMPVLRAETSGFCIAVFYEGRIYVDNVDFYEDMIGSVLTNALASTINGNDERISDVTLSNFEFSLVQFDIFPSEADSMIYHLESAKLVMANKVFAEQKVEVAPMIVVDGINGKVIFAPITDDLLEWIESNRPDQMYFEYKLRNFTKATGPLNVKYEILTSFDYSYESSEDK